MNMTVFPASAPIDRSIGAPTQVTPVDATLGLREASRQDDKAAVFAKSEGSAELEQAIDDAVETKTKSNNVVLNKHKLPSLAELRQLSQRRLRRINVALQGHAGNDDEIDEDLERAARDLLENGYDEHSERPFDDYLDNADTPAMKDPLRRFLLLCTAEKLLEAQQGDGTAQTAAAQDAVQTKLSKLDAAIDRALRTNGKRIRGGINTAEALYFFSNLIEERDQLRYIYYDTIVQGPSVRETFERLLKSFGPARFQHSVKTLRNAIVDDMRAPFPSSNKILLETYYQGLKDAHLIVSLIRSTEEMEKRVGPTALQNADGVVEFLSQTLRYTEGPGNTRQFKALCEAMVGKDDKEKAGSDSIKRHIKEFLLKALPLELWVDPETRNTVLTPLAPAAKTGAPAE